MLIVSRIILTTVIAFFTPTVHAGDKENYFPGIFGKDNRQIIESLDYPWNAIGRVNIAGYRQRRFCTGTLIAPRVVVTAAHCVTKDSSRTIARLRNIQFLSGLRRDQYVADASAKCVHLLNPDAPMATTVEARFKSDVALIILDKTLKIEPIKMATNLEFSTSIDLVYAGYARDRPYLLAADSSCKLRAIRRGLWLTDCDNNYGGSGGPVLDLKSGVLLLAAVMVGVIKNKFSVAVPISQLADLISKSDCS